MLGDVSLEELLAHGRRIGASDLHLAVEERPRFRCNGSLQSVDDTVVAASEFEGMCTILFGTTSAALLSDATDFDTSVSHPRFGELRLHAFRAYRGCRIAVRFLAERIADPHELGLPAAVVELFERDQISQGLFLFAGATGQGKTTALASLLEQINIRRNVHVVTIEDPIEYRFTSKRAHVSQREIGDDVQSFAAGIRAAMRMDPDVIAIGELRDAEAIAAALRAAETGHLVLATVHGSDTTAAIERIVDAFDDGKLAVRASLAASLRGVVAMRLLPCVSENARALATEVLIATDSVRALIRDEKTHQLRNAMLTGRAFGMHTFEASLKALIAKGSIDERTAQLASTRHEELCAQGYAA